MPDIEALADAILRAAGSGLRHYTMPGTRAAILRATEAAVQAGRDDAIFRPTWENPDGPTAA